MRRFEPTHLDDVSSLFHALVVGTLGLWLFYKVAPPPKLEFQEILAFGALALPLISGMRLLVRSANLRIQGPERVFVVAPFGDVMLLRRKLDNHPEYEMKLVGASLSQEDAAELGLALNTQVDHLETLIESGEIDHLLVQLDSTYLIQERVAELMRACSRAGIPFGAFPKEKSLLFPGVEVNQIEGMGFLSYHPPVLSRGSEVTKRILDVVISGVALAVLAVPMAIVALAIKLDSKGSALYRQTRVGRDGRHFQFVKFRTMIDGADAHVSALMEKSLDPDWLVIAGDPRVTRVGRFLRQTSIDELPQLWNVLKGDMSLVGPRPLPLRDDQAVKGWSRHRLDLVPGITGYWQVLGRNTIPFKEMLEIDYAYIANWSLWTDLKLLFKTVPVMVRRRGVN